MTKSNVRVVRHVVISVLINSRCWLFKVAFMAHSDSMVSDVSSPVIWAVGLCVNKHRDTPPVPMPTSRTDFAVLGAKAANQHASDVGLYVPRCILTRPPNRVKISCFVLIGLYNKTTK